MGDLISRKAVIDILENMIFAAGKDLTKVYSLQDVRERVIRLNAVFDKEKVMEDLNDWMKDAEKWATKYDEVGDIDNMDLQDMAARCYKVAIEIVEKGGLN